ncbi:MAG TPA: molybdopterin-dependent oxidoreductase [Acidobacteriota bacterium]|nr:molybdopterin-dependent oxidoreductase [Acidobacteriota bacterium]
MPTLEIDGQEVQVEEGSTIIQATEKLGIYVPRYCYHPGMSIAGSCRMCMVEVENMPKLAIACYTPVSDGMKVSTTSEKVLKGRRDMLEFLLHNHPLDCPVCDQSGECDLQNFYMEHGRYQSRFVENKFKKRKAFPIGPHVVLDQERCILCTRCTRFSDEVSKSHELGVFNRGDRSVIDLNPGKTLDNPYSGNVIDICPVGALTEREFRFQCRVWYLSTEESVCPGCSRGCNISIHYNQRRGYKAGGRRLQRLKPRFHPDINTWWMCDEGRFGYGFADQNRFEFPMLRLDGELQYAEWDEALDKAADTLKQAVDEHGAGSIGVIASPQLSNEELYLADKVFRQGLGVENVGFENPWQKDGFSDDFLIKGDKNPNTRGAREMGWDGDIKAILEKAASGEIKVLYLFLHDFAEEEAQALLDKAGTVIFHGSNQNHSSAKSDLVLASAVWAEKDGTFTNFEGRVQRFKAALQPLDESRRDVDILLDLAQRLGQQLVYNNAEDLFMEWFGMTYQDMNPQGENIENRGGSMPPPSSGSAGEQPSAN